MAKLERDLERLAKNRATQRKGRRRSAMSTVALVGYTNAGKSTLLNRLTVADVLVEDRLFSTLDPTTRRLRLTGGETVLISDTVGFVQRLPHQLVESFRSTLEEVVDADLLLHVVDASSPDGASQIDAVRTVLDEIGAGTVPELLVLNKADVASPGDVKALLGVPPTDAVVVSAVTGEGVNVLLDTVGCPAARPRSYRGAAGAVRTGRRGRRAPSGGRGARGSARGRRDTRAGAVARGRAHALRRVRRHPRRMT